MRVWATGGTGLLGRRLVADWTARGAECLSIARSGADIAVDLRGPDALDRLFERNPPDLIVNCAAETNHDRCEVDPAAAYSINVRLVDRLAAFAARSSTRLIHISTDHYYNGDGPARHSETHPLKIVNRYAGMKYAGELAALTAPNALVVRTNIVGFRLWRDRPTFAEWVLGTLSRGEPMTGFTDYYTSSLDVGSLTAALWELEQAERPTGLLNIASGEASSKHAFVTAFAERFGFYGAQIAEGSVLSLAGAPRANSLGLDTSAVESLLGRRMPGLRQVIDNLYKDYEGDDAIQQLFQDR